ncbi:3-oxoacyl-[acyl-carrier-protein] reductase FabG [compost metagenome]
MKSENKIALVTGGSRGLGKNAALRLAEKGLDVIITYNSKQQEALAVVKALEDKGVKAASLQLNVGSLNRYDDFSSTLNSILTEKWDRSTFDYLINNAGIDWAAPFAQTSEEQFDSLMNVHFKGTYFLTQKLLPLLADNGGIINLSTGLARFVIPGYSAYASMKGAIETFTKYLAKELGSRGIRANTVAPGAIDTDFNKANFDSHPEVKGFIASQTVLGRVGIAEDIGGVIAFLCTDDARWINAQRLEASGGMFL